MGATVGFLLRILATGTLWLGLLSPLILIALLTTDTKHPRRLLGLAALLYLELGCALAPHLTFFNRFDWNWQGKLLECLWVLALAALPGYSLARLGIRARLEPRSVVPLAIVAVLAVIPPMLMWSQGMRMPPDRETLLFELTLPGIAEELVFRGVFQSLLNEIFGRPWKIAGASFGWGAILTLALFGIGHGFLFDRSLHLETSLFGVGFALIPGALLGWLRERTGSVWPGIVVHNLVDGLPVVFSWLR